MEFVAAQKANEAFDEGKPSLFELLSEHQLASLLPPTLRYLLTVATHRYPRHLLRILNAFDELYALAALAVERHYLRTRGGSFTEHFYGLKRERALVAELPRASAGAPDAVADALRLRAGDVWRNLAVVVGLPYLKRKLDEAYEVDAPRALLGSAYTRLPAGATLRDRLRHAWRLFLRRVYPAVHAAYGFALLAFQLAYLFDGAKTHSPLLWLIGTRVRRMTAADHRALEARLHPKESARAAGSAAGSAPPPPGVVSAFAPRRVAGRVLGGLSLVLPASIFALKFLEWWHASDFAKQLSRRNGEALELPPPVVSGMPRGGGGGGLPGGGNNGGRDKSRTGGDASGREGDNNHEDENENEQGDVDLPSADTAPVAASSLLPIYTVPAPADSALCPICRDEIATATACQTGFVYCYACIHKWITGTHPRQERFMAGRQGKWESGEGRCAVTGRRVLGGTEGLRRIMV